MNVDLADLRAFVTVADQASFRSASDALHLSQAAMSRRVQKLEAALGFRLLERTTRRVELSAMGRAFLPRARHVLGELESALIGMTDLSDRIRGLVTIACIPSAVGNILADPLKAFHQGFPAVRLRLLDQPAPDILLSVTRGDADFGISYLGSHEPDLVFEPLLREAFVLACRSDHPLARRRRIRWSELVDHACIGLAPGSGNRLLIDQGLADAGVKPRWFCEVQHVPALLDLIEAGIGIGVVPRFALGGRTGSLLAGVPLVDPVIDRSIGLVRRRDRPLNRTAAEIHAALVAAHRAVSKRARSRARAG